MSTASTSKAGTEHRVGGPASGMPASGIPARGTTSRPPFTKGNLVRATSGARSPRVYGELAEHLTAGLVADRPDLGAYPEAVAAWATAEAQTALLRRHLAEVGPLDEGGQPRSSPLEWLTRLESAAAKHRERFGLDPRSEAALTRERAEARDVAVDLVALVERGRRALATREVAGLPAPPDLAGQVLDHHRDAYREESAHAAAEWAQAEPDDKTDDETEETS